MSTPQPNASTPPTVHTPPTISIPSPVGAVQTMMSSLPLPVVSQGAPIAYPTPALHPEIPPDAHLPTFVPPGSTLAPVTQIAAHLNAHASGSVVSSYGGRAPTPPHGTARARDPHYSFTTLPELLHHPPTSRSDLPQDVGCFGRLVPRLTSSKTVWHPRKPYKEGTVGARLQPTVDIAEVVANKAAQKARLTEWLLNGAIGLQVLIGALTTALGAVLSGKNTSVAISVLGGAATLVASFLARMRSSSEPDASRLRAKKLDGFLREVQAFQLDHGGDKGTMWDKEINNFRTGLENILNNRPGSVKDNPEAATPYSGAQKEVGAANPAPGFNNLKDGMYFSSAKNPV